MKNIAALIFLCTFFFAKAQTYIPMTEGERYWWYMGQDAENCRAVSGFMIGISEDTLVGNTKYKKVFKYDLAGEIYYPPPGSPFPPVYYFQYPYTVLDRHILGLIRDDTIAQRVYFLPLDTVLVPVFCSDEEYLLFDFGLSQGDTLDTCLLEGIKPWVSVVNEPWGIVDSIKDEMVYGKMRKVIHTKGQLIYCGLLFGPSHLRIVSGVGLENLGLFPMNANRSIGDLFSWRLERFCEGTWADCNIVSSASNAWADPQMVSPNPTSDYINVSLPSAYTDRSTMYFYDLTGRLLRRQRLRNSHNTLDISDLPRGVLFYTVESDRGIIGMGKLIVN